LFKKTAPGAERSYIRFASFIARQLYLATPSFIRHGEFPANIISLRSNKTFATAKIPRRFIGIKLKNRAPKGAA
jgi:hypothetical protein